VPSVLSVWAAPYSDGKVANRNFGFGTGRQRTALERWTNPKTQRHTRSTRHGVPPCRGESASRNGPVSSTSHPKSLQSHLFDRCTQVGDCEELGTRAFAVNEVHKIAVLDLRLANTDRNGANILVRRRGAEEAAAAGGVALQLIPIDHGYTLPHTLQDVSFEWEFWHQVRRTPASPMTHALIPIDHGYTLPHTLQDVSFEWEFWHQVRRTPASPMTHALIPIDHGYTLPHTLQDVSFEWEFWHQVRRTPASPMTHAHAQHSGAKVAKSQR
jgi:hypothetical protein